MMQKKLLNQADVIVQLDHLPKNQNFFKLKKIKSLIGVLNPFE